MVKYKLTVWVLLIAILDISFFTRQIDNPLDKLLNLVNVSVVK